jgi:hypothetical protein
LPAIEEEFVEFGVQGYTTMFPNFGWDTVILAVLEFFDGRWFHRMWVVSPALVLLAPEECGGLPIRGLCGLH